MFDSELFGFPWSVNGIAEVEESIDIAPPRFVSDCVRRNSGSHRQASYDQFFWVVLGSNLIKDSSITPYEDFFRVRGPGESPSRLHVWKVEFDS